MSERFIGKNTTLPILSHLLLKAEKDILKISATNLEYAIEIKLPSKVTHEGSVAIPARIAASFVQSLPNEEIFFESKGGHLYLKTPSREACVQGLPVDDFPLIPSIHQIVTITIPANELKQGLEKVLPAVALSEFKPELTGIFFNASPTALYLAATDTFRLAESVYVLPSQKIKESFSFLLPARTAQEVIRALTNESEVEIHIGDNQILFKLPSVQITSRLIEGAFPEYTQIIPKNFEFSCIVSRDEVIRAVRAASVFASKLQDVVLSFQGKNVHITSSNQDIGNYKITLPIAASGKPKEVSFNHRYFLDGLQALGGNELFIGINNEHSPVLIRDKEDTSFVYVLMPIRVT